MSQNLSSAAVDIGALRVKADIKLHQNQLKMNGLISTMYHLTVLLGINFTDYRFLGINFTD